MYLLSIRKKSVSAEIFKRRAVCLCFKLVRDNDMSTASATATFRPLSESKFAPNRLQSSHRPSQPSAPQNAKPVFLPANSTKAQRERCLPNTPPRVIPGLVTYPQEQAERRKWYDDEEDIEREKLKMQEDIQEHRNNLARLVAKKREEQRLQRIDDETATYQEALLMNNAHPSEGDDCRRERHEDRRRRHDDSSSSESESDGECRDRSLRAKPSHRTRDLKTAKHKRDKGLSDSESECSTETETETETDRCTDTDASASDSDCGQNGRDRRVRRRLWFKGCRGCNLDRVDKRHKKWIIWGVAGIVVLVLLCFLLGGPTRAEGSMRFLMRSPNQCFVGSGSSCSALPCSYEDSIWKIQNNNMEQFKHLSMMHPGNRNELCLTEGKLVSYWLTNEYCYPENTNASQQWEVDCEHKRIRLGKNNNKCVTWSMLGNYMVLSNCDPFNEMQEFDCSSVIFG